MDELGHTTTLVHQVEMTPTMDSLTTTPPFRVHSMIGLVLIFLLVESIALEVQWWQR